VTYSTRLDYVDAPATLSGSGQAAKMGVRSG
jgi:hypothetical protein